MVGSKTEGKQANDVSGSSQTEKRQPHLLCGVVMEMCHPIRRRQVLLPCIPDDGLES